MRNREPTFRDLTRFMDRQARVAKARCNSFGRSPGRGRDRPIGEGRSGRVQYRQNYVKDRYQHLNVIAASKPGHIQPGCVACPGKHRLNDCPAYNKLKVDERWDLVKTKGCCFGCLAHGHRLNNCENRKACNKDGCLKWHHVTLHSNNRRPDEGEKHVCTIIKEENQEISLGVLPVRVDGPRGSEFVYALIDNGADATLVNRRLMRHIGVSSPTTSIMISTVTATRRVAAERCNLTVRLLDERGTVRMKDVCL